MRDQFRPSLFVQNIHQVENYDPAYEYKNVIFTYKHDPGRVSRYLEAGWEIVETTENLRDDRSFSPKSKEDKIRPQPCVTKTTDKHEQVLMRILRTKRAENELEKRNMREQLSLREAKKRGDKIEKRGNEVITKGAELTEKEI
jgi:hypothetical protein